MDGVRVVGDYALREDRGMQRVRDKTADLAAEVGG